MWQVYKIRKSLSVLQLVVSQELMVIRAANRKQYLAEGPQSPAAAQDGLTIIANEDSDQ